MKTQMLVAAWAALAMAAPAAESTGKSTSAAPPFNCVEAFNTCLHEEGFNGKNDSYAAQDCGKKIQACGDCAKQESQCWASAFSNKPSGVDCTAQAANCYFKTWNPATTVGKYYDCDSASATCTSQPFLNHAFCTSLYGRCQSCQTEENKCRTAPQANQAFCSSQAGSCFYKAVGGK